MFWSNESPFMIFGGKRRSYVRRWAGEGLHRDFVNKDIEHGRGKINVWDVFSSNEVGSQREMDGIMDQKAYKKFKLTKPYPAYNV